MPKVKPDKVIRHEIVLGRADRQLLEGAITAYQVNRIATPVINLLNDNTSLLLIAGILEATGVIDIVPDWLIPSLKEGAYDTYEDFVDAAKNAGEDWEAIQANPIVRGLWFIYKKATPAGQFQEIVESL